MIMMMLMMMISNGSFLEKCEKSSNGFATSITSFERGWILWEQFTAWKLAPARERASDRPKNECALEQAVSQASPTATAYGVDATGRGFKPGRGRVLDCFNTRLFRSFEDKTEPKNRRVQIFDANSRKEPPDPVFQQVHGTAGFHPYIYIYSQKSKLNIKSAIKSSVFWDFLYS